MWSKFYITFLGFSLAVSSFIISPHALFAHANMTNDPSYYFGIDRVYLRQPGEIIDLRIQIKAQTTGTAEAVFSATYE